MSFIHVTVPSEAGESDLSLQAVFPPDPNQETVTASDVDTVQIPLDDVVPSFDSSLGTLLEITLRVTSDMQLSAEFAALDPLGGSVWMIAGGNIGLVESGGRDSLETGVQCTGTGSCSVASSVSDDDGVIHIGLFLPQDLPAELVLERTIELGALRLGNFEVTASVEGSWSADLFVTYYYEPFGVPEPGAALLLAVGFVALARVRK